MLAAGRPKQERMTSASSARLPTSNSGSAYMEGFRAGETRAQIGLDKTAIWLEGYCAGLRASMDVNTGPGKDAPLERSSQAILDGVQSLVVNDAHRPDRRDANTQRAPCESNAASMDRIKEAAFSAQNENVILSPDSSTPTVDDLASAKIDQWSKNREAASTTESVLTQLRNGQVCFPERTCPAVERPLTGPDTVGTEAKATSSSKNTSVPVTRRNFSTQSQPGATSQSAYLRAVYPGNRVLSSQLEWKSGSSIAQVAGLAQGYVAQYDGTLNDLAALGGEMAPLTRTSGNAGAIATDSSSTSNKASPIASAQRTKFVEGSMQTDEHINDSPTSSPSKKSPTKAKFAHIAGMAGIKVRVEDQVDEERTSPRDKPRWRDVWRKGH